MKKFDVILIVGILVIAGIGYLVMSMITNNSNITDGIAKVYYKSDVILEIRLQDGSYIIKDNDYVIEIDESKLQYTVLGDNGPVVIQYKDNQVAVIAETSPKHICQLQGYSGSPLSPISCLPNNIVIIIEASNPQDSEFDGITG